MGWANDRAQALSLLRSYIRTEVNVHGRRSTTVVHEVQEAITVIVQEAAKEHDMPGVRYWYLPETESYWVTMPGEQLPTEGSGLIANLVIELTRPEFLGRQKINFGYEYSGI